jgi:lipoprotein-anchoring transpeptidase ErfK/SrfK
MKRFAILVWVLNWILVTASVGVCVAQAWPSPTNHDLHRPYYVLQTRSHKTQRPPSIHSRQRQPGAAENEDEIRDGGPRPQIAPKAPPTVAFPYEFPQGSIVIDVGGRKLYFVLPEKRAYAYRISVGREGFNWTGTENITRKVAWPDWTPPPEMRERDPNVPEKMTGGIKNPLGAMALYLGKTEYRIHGTSDAKSIGRARSSGCFRLLNPAVLHLATITEIGTRVTVLTSLSKRENVSRATER